MNVTKAPHIILAAVSLLACGSAHAQPDQSAQAAAPSYEIVDLGTLGGANSSAAAIAGQAGRNAAGMVVGASNASDNSEHAFLYFNDQMYDLNDLCDLGISNFRVLTVAKSIDDAGEIIGEGLTSDNQKHAFLLKPTLVDGGNWSYDCCRWVWKQQTDGAAVGVAGPVETGWWWESDSHSYKWHGGPGKHADCPKDPPHCWNWPLPCPLSTGSQPYPHPCWCCLNGQVVQVNDAKECSAKGGQCFPSKKAAEAYCRKKICWCCFQGGYGKGGIVAQLPEEQCKKRGGQCYTSEAEARQQCSSSNPPPPPGADVLKKKKCWCCHNGVVSEIPQPDCIALGGACYASEADAKKHCAPKCWCCHNGIVSEIPKTECIAISGHCYGSEAEAKKNCAVVVGPAPTQMCWCCPDFNNGSTPVWIPNTQCEENHGYCFPSQEVAIANCQGQPYAYCCIDGVVSGPMPRAQCAGQAFHSAQEAQQYCGKQPAPAAGDNCWCCDPKAGGSPLYLKKAICEQRGEQCFSTQQEAIAWCESIQYVWCCDVGGLDQVPAGPMPRQECFDRNKYDPGASWTPFYSLELANKYCAGKKAPASVPFLKGPGVPFQSTPPKKAPRLGPRPDGLAPINTPVPQITPWPDKRQIPAPQFTPRPQVTPNIYHRPSRGPRRLQTAPATPPSTPGTLSRSPTSTSSVHRRFPVKGLTTPPTPTPPVIR